LQRAYPPDPLCAPKFRNYLYGISEFLRLKNPPAGYGILQKNKPFLMKGASQTMENRERQNLLTLRLSDDELYILAQKCKASNMKDKSSFLRHLILYGYVYEVSYN
jgi:hypothetical protein